MEGLLSIDNAAVLGAMVSVLPADQAVPYPRPFRFLQNFTDQALGTQQMAALKVGLFMAYLGRGLMLTMAAWISSLSFLKILGAVYLLKLALEHLSQREASHSQNDQTASETKTLEISSQERKAMATFWLVVLNVELADLVFSLDNVIVAVALSRQLWVVLLGVAVGIIVMRFAAGLFTWLIKHEPAVITAAYIIVFNIGIELLLAELFQVEFNTWYKFTISIGTLLLCVIYARWKYLQALAPLFGWIGREMGHLNRYCNRTLYVATLPFKFIFAYLFD